MLNKFAEYLLEKLNNILRETMVSVKVDGAARFSRSFLGINVQVSWILRYVINRMRNNLLYGHTRLWLQVIHDFQIVVYTLCMKEITERYTGENLKDILSELANFGIRVEDIHTVYSITSDSGSNMVKAIKLLDEYYREIRFGLTSEVHPEEEDLINEMMRNFIEDVLWGYDRIIGEL